MATYAIISVGGKQYRVREGERLLVDRLATAEGKTFQPDVLFTGGEGDGNLSPRMAVTAKVVGHVRGDKIRIGKRRPKTGYRRQTGFRAALSQIEIESIGASKRAAAGCSFAAGAGASFAGAAFAGASASARFDDAAPIDWISICDSAARKPVWRR